MTDRLPEMRTLVYTDGAAVCPRCGGTETENCFGIAGGGYGAYLWCNDCRAVVAKTENCDDD